MAGAKELAAALLDYQQRCNDNARLRRMLRNWNRVVHIAPTDDEARFTMTITDTLIASVKEGLAGTPDLVVHATSEDFCDMFWGDLNPAEKYLNGEIKLQGSVEDVMRIDAMSMVMFLNE